MEKESKRENGEESVNKRDGLYNMTISKWIYNNNNISIKIT